MLIYAIVNGQTISKDFIPLAIGNQWTYSYYSNISTFSEQTTINNGTAIYSIQSKLVDNDSIIWTVKEVRNVLHVYRSCLSCLDSSYTINDSTIFQIVEEQNGNHAIRRIGEISDCWESVFPFAIDSSGTTGFYRYYPTTSTDSISVVNAYYSPVSYTIDASFRKSIGLVKLSYMHSYLLDSWYTNHVLQSSVLMSLESPNKSILPNDYIIGQNYPNPFNSQTIIPIRLTRDAKVLIRIYDVLGRTVSVIYDGTMQVGDYKLQWISSYQSSGIYLCVVNINGLSQSLKMVFIK